MSNHEDTFQEIIDSGMTEEEAYKLCQDIADGRLQEETTVADEHVMKMFETAVGKVLLQQTESTNEQESDERPFREGDRVRDKERPDRSCEVISVTKIDPQQAYSVNGTPLSVFDTNKPYLDDSDYVVTVSSDEFVYRFPSERLELIE